MRWRAAQWCCGAFFAATLLGSAQSSFTVVLPSGRSLQLPLAWIGGYPAIGLPAFARAWGADAQLAPDGTALRFAAGTIRSAPQSFFLAWETSQRQGILQLPVPARPSAQGLLLPASELLQAVASVHGWELVGTGPTSVRFVHSGVPAAAPTPPSVERTPSGLRRPPLPPLPIPVDTALPRRSLPLREPPSRLPALAALGNSFTVSPIRIVELGLHPQGNGLLLRLTADRTIERYQRPEWQGNVLVLRIPDALHGAGTPNSPELLDFRAERVQELLRYRFRFRSEILSCRWQRSGPRSLLIELTFARGAAPRQWELDVIVLDPGHGGEDTGALGVLGTREKDITLAVAQKVRQVLTRRLPGVRVVLTREGDEFVPLYRRGQLANEQQGKLFISLHCNAAPEKPHPARGVETYVLRPGRTPEAIRVAERENAVIRLESNPERYRGLLDEQHIMATLAHSAFMRLSDRLAAHLQRELVRSTGLPDRGIQQAGFYVLVGASMPAVLVEMGFLSHPEEERFLRSERGQWRIAEGIARALQRYATEYRRLLRSELP